MRKRGFWLLTLAAALILTSSLAAAQADPINSPTGVSILVNRDGVNVRLFPEIGAEVIGFVSAGWRAPATGRSPDNQWVRVDFNGEEGWLGFPVINVFGDLNSLPVADPRTIPYGGFESPRAGLTSATSSIAGRLADSGMRVRAGPSRAYPVLANAPRYTVFPLLGRTISNGWVQVNFEGTLGWVAVRYVEILGNASIVDLPVDGIVADSLPISGPTAADYEATLRLLLARVELAQPSLDAIRAIWTNIALGGESACGGFPARPSNYNIPNPLLAAFYGTLDGLQTLFNDAMTNVRAAIDLWLDVCQRPQPQRGVVGRATVQGALLTVNTADAQFLELRRRLNELLPAVGEVGPDQCLFTFQGASDILPVIPIGQIVRGTLDPSQRTVGFCFDVDAGKSLRFEFLQVKGNALPLAAVTPFDNPTAFLATGRAFDATTALVLGPVLISTPGRYLFIISDTGTPALTSDFAALIGDVTGQTVLGPSLQLDPSGQVIIAPPQPPAFLTPTPLPGFFTPVPPGGTAVCPSLAFTCAQLLSCAEAQACLAAGNFTLDPDNNGIPCEGTLCQP